VITASSIQTGGDRTFAMTRCVVVNTPTPNLGEKNPTYYHTTKSWEKLSCIYVNIEKNKSNPILEGNGALNGHKYILPYMRRC
jgi:hypothetical protein